VAAGGLAVGAHQDRELLAPSPHAKRIGADVGQVARLTIGPNEELWSLIQSRMRQLRWR
jgi:hypothetical protein